MDSMAQETIRASDAACSRTRATERVEFVRFAKSHLEGAATLLAHRHRGEREREPYLSSRFDDVSAALSIVKATALSPGVDGVAAVRGDRVLGYLLGSKLVTPGTARSALFLQPRCAFISYGGYAVDPHAGAGLLEQMYATLAAGWVAAGHCAHYAQVAAGNAEIQEVWYALGFGCDMVTVVRNTVSPAHHSAAVEIRRAGPDDLDAVMRLVTGLYRHQAGPPMFAPYLVETEPDERQYQSRLLAHRTSAIWLASVDGRMVGLQSFQPPPSSVSPMLQSRRCTYLLHGFTEAGDRGKGIGDALLSRSMAWAREAGYDHCLLSFLSANALAARFWMRNGYRSIERRLYRRVDDRASHTPGS